MAKIVICEFMDERAVTLLAAQHEVIYDAGLQKDAARLLVAAADCDVLIVRNLTQVRGDLLAALGNPGHCKIIGRLGVGLENIDVPGCESFGMAVIPAAGANAQSVAEYVIASAMLLLRGAYGCTQAVAAGGWPRAALSNGREIAGQTLGIIGFGSIGQLTSRLALGLGMKVVAFDATLALDAPVFARAGVLSAALRSGALGGAAIDVFDTEPLPLNEALQNCPNLLLTPHISGLSVQANERVSFMIAERVLAGLERLAG